ncbi:hypothetical protein RF11_13477 [Thelohanellus kitauei]|uniref:Uncharacterized protein n=1 Tax=Thelohanellus kitauei TaxID=669202 RepID=A0A0C2MDI6_THEKT|nr:hypothetical protein RF11_13477 [Thelohanellus kitauei]
MSDVCDGRWHYLNYVDNRVRQGFTIAVGDNYMGRTLYVHDRATTGASDTVYMYVDESDHLYSLQHCAPLDEQLDSINHLVARQSRVYVYLDSDLQTNVTPSDSFFEAIPVSSVVARGTHKPHCVGNKVVL